MSSCTCSRSGPGSTSGGDSQADTPKGVPVETAGLTPAIPSALSQTTGDQRSRVLCSRLPVYPGSTEVKRVSRRVSRVAAVFPVCVWVAVRRSGAVAGLVSTCETGSMARVVGQSLIAPRAGRGLRGCGGRAFAGSGGGKRADPFERLEVVAVPGPAGGEVERPGSAVAGESAGDLEPAAAEGAGRVAEGAVSGRPSSCVQRSRLCASAAITVQAPVHHETGGGEVRECLFFEVGDHLFDDGVVALGVYYHRRQPSYRRRDVRAGKRHTCTRTH